MFYIMGLLSLSLSCITLGCFSQDQQSPPSDQRSSLDKLVDFPSGFLGKIEHKTASLDRQLDKQTEKYLSRMARREARLQKKIFKIDSAAGKKLFAGSRQHYDSLTQRLKTDTGSRSATLAGEYKPGIDTLKTSLSFLQKNPQLLSSGNKDLPPQVKDKLNNSISQLQALQAKMQDADEIKAYVRNRQDQIRQYLSQYTQLPAGLTQEYNGMKQDLYYYSQQVREYKEALNNPDQIAQKALDLLNKLPVFQNFMKNNSQLAALFGQPGNYGTPAALAGLQTRTQMQQVIQGQVTSGGPDAMGALQTNFEEGQQQMSQLKDKLSQLGVSGGANIDMPDFKPNAEKTHSFLRRLEYGMNLQTTHMNNYYPIITDFGLSIGYKINNTSTIGVGTSFKLGWGSGLQHMALSANGLSVRSFMDIKLKGSISATGGLEYNYTLPVTSLHAINNLNDWTPSGLIGLTKTVQVKSRTFKKTKLQVFWDFLSYQQLPKRSPILFRVGYAL